MDTPWMTKDKNLKHMETLNKIKESVCVWNIVAGTMTGEKEKDLQRQWGLVREECKELIDAYDSKDPCEFVKELCDLLVVGTQLMNIDEYTWENKSFPLYHTKDVSQLVGLIRGSVRQMCALTLMQASLSLYYTVDADMEGAFEAVNKNNWSKFTNDMDILKRTVAKHDSEGVDTYISHLGGMCSIKRASDNKVMKPVGFQKLATEDLKCFINDKWL